MICLSHCIRPNEPKERLLNNLVVSGLTNPLWFRTAKNRDVSTGSFARPFAHNTHSFAHSFAHCQTCRILNDPMSQNDLVLSHCASLSNLGPNIGLFSWQILGLTGVMFLFSAGGIRLSAVMRRDEFSDKWQTPASWGKRKQQFGNVEIQEEKTKTKKKMAASR